MTAKMVILSGISGSGKTTYAAGLGASRIVSTDDYWEGREFDASLLTEAHTQCFGQALEWLVRNGSGLLVVDNTNLSAYEISPYMMLAQLYKVPVEIHRVCCAFDTARARQIHDVPYPTHARQAGRFLERNVMPWWEVIDVRS